MHCATLQPDEVAALLVVGVEIGISHLPFTSVSISCPVPPHAWRVKDLASKQWTLVLQSTKTNIRSQVENHTNGVPVSLEGPGPWGMGGANTWLENQQQTTIMAVHKATKAVFTAERRSSGAPRPSVAAVLLSTSCNIVPAASCGQAVKRERSRNGMCTRTHCCQPPLRMYTGWLHGRPMHPLP